MSLVLRVVRVNHVTMQLVLVFIVLFVEMEYSIQEKNVMMETIVTMMDVSMTVLCMCQHVETVL